jgi:hypothetical protein
MNVKSTTENNATQKNIVTFGKKPPLYYEGCYNYFSSFLRSPRKEGKSMQIRRINLTRLVLLLLLALTTMAGSCPRSVRRANFFPPCAAINLFEPPQDQLMVWLEGNIGGPAGSYMLVNSSGTVTAWADQREALRGAFPVLRNDNTFFAGQRVSVPITTPRGESYDAFALRCGDGRLRCAYLVRPTSFARDSLDGTPYTILAVVQRASGRGDNYFVMTSGVGCDRTFGTSCTTNTALHVGWSGERTIRLGQYGEVGREDVTFESAPAFNSNARTRSLFVAISGMGEGKTIALLEPDFNDGNTIMNLTPLERTSALFIGGTPFGTWPPGPDWHFEGDIFAVLIYSKVLNAAEMFEAQEYLRNRYGPR